MVHLEDASITPPTMVRPRGFEDPTLLTVLGRRMRISRVGLRVKEEGDLVEAEPMDRMMMMILGSYALDLGSNRTSNRSVARRMVRFGVLDQVMEDGLKVRDEWKVGCRSEGVDG